MSKPFFKTSAKEANANVEQILNDLSNVDALYNQLCNAYVAGPMVMLTLPEIVETALLCLITQAAVRREAAGKSSEYEPFGTAKDEAEDTHDAEADESKAQGELDDLLDVLFGPRT